LGKNENSDAELMLEDYKSAMNEFSKFPPKVNSSMKKVLLSVIRKLLKFYIK